VIGVTDTEELIGISVEFAAEFAFAKGTHMTAKAINIAIKANTNIFFISLLLLG
jgi:hypothetical protein